MEIKTAIEGREACDRLRKDLAMLQYNPDLQKMFRNIEKMVPEISRKEVECRRIKHNYILEEPLKQLNDAVKHLDQLILIAKLMG